MNSNMMLSYCVPQMCMHEAISIALQVDAKLSDLNGGYAKSLA